MTPGFSDFDLSPEAFRRRSGWARAQGNPRWLWPDVRIDEWRSALERLERALSGLLTQGTAREPLDGDPEVMMVAGYTSGVGPLLGYWIEQGKLAAAPAVAAAFALQLRHNRLRMARMVTRATDAIQALASQGISATVLKGMHTAFGYFPEPGTRPLADIDLLVSPEDAARANECYRYSGYYLTHRSGREHSWRPAASPSEPRSLMLTHADDPWTIDLHNSLDYQPASAARPARLDVAARSVAPATWLAAPAGRALGQPLLLLHLASHASCGLENLTLVRLAELALVARKDAASGDLQWDPFLALGETAEALGIVYPALRLCEALAPGTIPPTVLAKCRQAAPPAVGRFVDRLTPATAQRLDSTSIARHFMWSRGWSGLASQLWRDFFPRVTPAQAVAGYELRATRLLRMRFGE